MDGNMDDMNPGLLRQRRNLILACVLLLGLMTMGAGVDQISIGGVVLNMKEKSQILFMWIWLIVFYFAWRYLAYFIAHANDLFDFYNKALDRYSKKTVIDSIKEEKTKIKKEGYDYIPLSKFNRVGNEYHGDVKFWTEKNTSGHVGLKKSKIVIPAGKLILPKLKSILFSVLFAKTSTDYIFPFVLFVVLCLCGIYSSWEGSLRSVGLFLLC